MHFTPLSPKIILGIAAHPDDLDFGAAGALAKYAREGAEIYYLILTDGGRGSEDRTMTPERLRDLRCEEQRRACEVVGAKDVFFCDYPDGLLANTEAVRRDIVRVIRRIKPDVMITMDPSVLYVAEYGMINHPDHRAAGQAALDAVFPLARDHMSFPELLDEGLEPHKTPTVLLINFKEYNFGVDISEQLDTKFSALAAHASQMPEDLGYIRETLTKHAEKTGRELGCRYAEAFMRIDVWG